MTDRMEPPAGSVNSASTDFLQNLIRASASGEAAVQEKVAQRLRQMGCQVETIRYRPDEVRLTNEFASDDAMNPGERVSVVGRLKGSGGGRSLIFFAHPDGEPVANTETWNHDPFAGKIENGRLYGWGVADDLAGVAAAVDGLGLVIAGGRMLQGDVIVASTPSKRNARGVAAVLNHGYTADAAVYLHPAESGEGLHDIKAFSSGMLAFRITVTGRPPITREPLHGAFAHLAVDPIEKAILIWQALRELAQKRADEVHHPALEKAVGRSTNIQVTYIHSGEELKYNLMSDRCVMGGTASFPPSEQMSNVKDAIEKAVLAAAAGDSWLREHPPRIDWRFGSNGIDVPDSHPLYRAVSESVIEVSGFTPTVNPLHTSSDIRVPFVQEGIPTVGLGPLCGDLTQVGGRDEWVDAEDYRRLIRIAASVIERWCGVG